MPRSSRVPIVSPPADRLLKEGEVIEYAGLRFEVREIPGHSPGHIVFLSQGHQPVLIFGGDVLFQGSIGRTDFPGGSFRNSATASTASSIRCRMTASSSPATVPPRPWV